MPAIFDTESLAEYHKYAFRLILHSHTKPLLVPNKIELDMNILVDDSMCDAKLLCTLLVCKDGTLDMYILCIMIIV